MIKYMLLAIILLQTGIILAQDTNPKIGSEKEVKEKFLLIKKGLPDIKKNLTKRDETFVDEYNVKFEMGNGIVLFREDKEEGYQSLTISYTKSYFSGTITDFQNYYKTLVAMIKEVFGPGYELKVDNEEKFWSTSFYEKGKESGPHVRIDINCSWILDLLRITIDIYSKH